MKRVKRGYFDHPFGQLHYRSINLDRDLPLLIMFHQSPLSSRNYQAVLPFLGDNFRVVAIDTPGFGQSDLPAETWEVDDYGRLAGYVADSLNSPKFYLFGRATGAVFAFAASLLFSERVDKLVLHGMPVYTPEERENRLASFAPPYEISNDGKHFDWIWSRIHSEYPWIGADLATHFSKDFLDAGPDFATSYRAIWRYDLPAIFAAAGSKLTAPTLVIGGSEDRIGFMHERVTSLLTGAEHCVIAGATDFVAEQDPAGFAARLTSFLK